MSRLPAALFVVDIKRTHRNKRSSKIKHSSFAMVDNSDPREVEFVIPSK
jgi:ribosomal protein S2